MVGVVEFVVDFEGEEAKGSEVGASRCGGEGLNGVIGFPRVSGAEDDGDCSVELACEGVVVFDEGGELILAAKSGLGVEVGPQEGLDLFLEGFLLGGGVVFAFADSLEGGPEECGPFGGSSHSHGSEEDGGLRVQ